MVLTAWSASHNEVRTFKLGRIRKLDVTKNQFTPPRNAPLEKPFGLAWSMIPEGTLYDVHLRFQPMVAGNVAEVRWHETQHVQWNEDGSIDFFVRVDGLGEIAWWILGYGDQVEVVAPPALRQRIARSVRGMAQTYAREMNECER